MDGRKVAREVRLQYWSGVIQARQQSGQTMREYCGENGVKEKSYYYWQNRLRKAACEALAVRQENGATPTFSEIPLPLSRSSQHAAITMPEPVVGLTFERYGIFAAIRRGYLQRATYNAVTCFNQSNFGNIVKLAIAIGELSMDDYIASCKKKAQSYAHEI